MSKKDLIERWKIDPQSKLVFKKIIDLITIGGKFQWENISIELVEDKIDLRGFDLGGQKIVKSEFNNIDFSFSTFKNTWVESSSFEGCHFDKVDFSDFSDHGNFFKKCSFTDCKFNAAAIGFDGTNFLECLFDNCKFNKTIFNRPEFVGVHFKNIRIKNIDFNASSFENCFFEGALKDVWFRGGFPLQSDNNYYGTPKKNEMKNVSFENADLEDLTFSDQCDLSTVRIKQSEIYHKYNRWKERLDLLKIESLKWSDKERKEADIFVNTYLVHAKNQDWYIINKNDVERDYGSDVSVKIFEFWKSV